MKFEITYPDGQATTVKVKPKHFMRAERDGRSAADKSSIENTFYLAWLAAGAPDDFDEWVDSTDDIKNVDEDAAKAGVDGVGPTSGESQP